MIAFAFVDREGCVIRSGTARALPEGATLLPELSADPGRVLWTGDAWADRPVLPQPVATPDGFVVAAPKGVTATVTVTEIGSGESLALPLRGRDLDQPLAADGEWEITVSAPSPWVETSLTVVRGTGSAALAALRMQSARQTAHDRVNARAGQVRLRFYTDIPGQDALYLEKRAEALAYVALPVEPKTLTDFPLLQGEVGITAPSAWQLAQIWLHLSDLFKQVGGITERARMQATIAIATAESEDAIQTIMADFNAALALIPT